MVNDDNRPRRALRLCRGNQGCGRSQALLALDVSFRALTPGRFWEQTGVDAIVDDVTLGEWFPPERSITAILVVDRDTVVDVEHVTYRFRATCPDGDYVIE